jgi:glycosyltransferase involved in cell wall biosynthesis
MSALNGKLLKSSSGGTNLFINSKNGILVELNAEEIASAMERMVVNSEKTKEMGLYAREFVMQNHTIEKSSVYYSGLYNKAYNKVF